MAYLLQQYLTESARRFPDKPAVWARKRTISYRELDERSNQLANLFHQRGLRKGDRIGIYFPKNVESIAVMFGALKAGLVYVPLDPQAPADRVGYILQNCGIRALVTDEKLRRSFDAEFLSAVEFTVLVGTASPEAKTWKSPENTVLWEELAAYAADTVPHVDATTCDLAYMLYTSGSTGKPKGVMLTHQNAITFVEWCAAEFNVTPDDRLSNHAPLHFDLSVFDVYNGIKAGATTYLITQDLLLFPTSLKDFIEKQEITIWYSVPSALVLLLQHGLTAEKAKSLRIILFAGEVFAMKYLKQLATLLPFVDLYNLYGPTETNVCTYHKVDHVRLPSMERLPIGKACANTEVFALDDDGVAITPGCGREGDLYARGPSVTPGYWGDAEKTATMCVRNPFNSRWNEIVYRTGDICVLDEIGDYYYVGRRDAMVKVRGYRIELGEIEAALLGHAEINEAAAVAIPDEEAGNKLKGFVALHSGSSLTPADLQAHCAQKIPKYMIPETFEVRKVLPKTSTGKIDRVTLAKQAVEAIASAIR